MNTEQKIRALPTPLNDRVYLEEITEGERRVGGIILPDFVAGDDPHYRVLAVGEGRRNSQGDRITPDVKQDDIILLARNCVIENVPIDPPLIVVREPDIVAVLT